MSQNVNLPQVGLKHKKYLKPLTSYDVKSPPKLPQNSKNHGEILNWKTHQQQNKTKPSAFSVQFITKPQGGSVRSEWKLLGIDVWIPQISSGVPKNHGNQAASQASQYMGVDPKIGGKPQNGFIVYNGKPY